VAHQRKALPIPGQD